MAEALRRFSAKRPGRDCVRHPCGKHGCGTRTGAGHGIADETWHYAVSDGVVALSLDVGSGIYPKSVPLLDARRPHGRWLHVHTAFPRDRDDVRDGRAGGVCDYVDGGRCFGGEPMATQASNLYEVCGGDSFEQSEGFWQGLESAWRLLAKPSYEKRADDFERCSHCDGTGTVRRGVK